MAIVPTRRSGWRKKWPTRAACSIRCPAATQIHQRLTELLSIGNIGVAADRRAVLFLHAARRHAEPAGPLCARRGRRKRSRAGRCQPAGRRWHDRARLVPAFREWQVCGLRHLGERLGDEHAAHHRNQHRQICCPTRSSARAPPALRGSPTTPASITRAIPRRATSPTGRRCTTGTSSITRWAAIPTKIR